MTPKATLERPFHCNWPGCTNSYARSEHLNRHRLNHEPVKIYQCESCPKTFVRSDLLFRHKDRHARRTTKQTPNGPSRYKSIRPARSDSTSSREDSSTTQPLFIDVASSGGAQATDRHSPYTGSPGFNLTQSLAHSQGMLQSPYTSPNLPISGGMSSSFEGYAVHHRTNTHTSPMPAMQPSHHSPPYDRTPQIPHADSSALPPIRANHGTKPRTYSVESLLNERGSKECSAVRDSAIDE